MSEAIQPGSCHPLGATPTPGGVNFSVYSEDATSLELLLFTARESPEDIVEPCRAPVVTEATYRVAPRSIVLLVSDEG